MDPTGPVFISDTPIPRATDAEDIDSMQRFLGDQGRSAFNLARIRAPHEASGDPSVFMFSPKYEVPHIGVLADGSIVTSPTASGTDDHSVTDLCSSHGGTWSSPASDVGPFNGLRRQSERTVSWYRSRSDADDECFVRRCSTASGYTVSGCGEAGGYYIDPRQVQPISEVTETCPDQGHNGSSSGLIQYTFDSHPGPVSAVTNEDQVPGQRTPPTNEEATDEGHNQPGEDESSHRSAPLSRRPRVDQTRPKGSNRVVKSKPGRRCTAHPDQTFNNAEEWRCVFLRQPSPQSMNAIHPFRLGDLEES